MCNCYMFTQPYEEYWLERVVNTFCLQLVFSQINFSGGVFPTLVEMFDITGLSNVYVTCVACKFYNTNKPLHYHGIDFG